MTMLEAMAKAAYEETLRLAHIHYPGAAIDAWLPWDQVMGVHREGLIKSQVAALKVLREPTEAMSEAGLRDYCTVNSDEPVLKALDAGYKAMIDAVLADAP